MQTNYSRNEKTMRTSKIDKTHSIMSISRIFYLIIFEMKLAFFAQRKDFHKNEALKYQAENHILEFCEHTSTCIRFFSTKMI